MFSLAFDSSARRVHYAHRRTIDNCVVECKQYKTSEQQQKYLISVIFGKQTQTNKHTKIRLCRCREWCEQFYDPKGRMNEMQTTTIYGQLMPIFRFVFRLICADRKTAISYFQWRRATVASDTHKI